MALTLQHPSLVIPQLSPTPVREACFYDQRKTRLTETLVWRLLVGMTQLEGAPQRRLQVLGGHRQTGGSGPQQILPPPSRSLVFDQQRAWVWRDGRQQHRVWGAGIGLRLPGAWLEKATVPHF